SAPELLVHRGSVAEGADATLLFLSGVLSAHSRIANHGSLHWGAPSIRLRRDFPPQLVPSRTDPAARDCQFRGIWLVFADCVGRAFHPGALYSPDRLPVLRH